MLRLANWQRQQDPNAPRPDLLLLPGMKAPDDSEGFGADPIPISQFNDWWDNN